MATPQAATETTLRLERTVPGTPQAVYAAWTQAEALTRWFAPSADYVTRVPRLEARVGGAYRIEMQPPGGDPHIVHGTYRELVPGERLVFTWQWEGDSDSGESLVTIELTAAGKDTKLVLTHERFPDAEVRDKHMAGWTGCLDRLPGAIG